MARVLPFPTVCKTNSRYHALLVKIQQEALNVQVKDRLGWKVWRHLFKGCRYHVAYGCLTVIAPTEQAAGEIAMHYRTTLEQLFDAHIRVESPKKVIPFC